MHSLSERVDASEFSEELARQCMLTIVYYRTMIGLFNTLKMKRVKFLMTNMVSILMFIRSYVSNCMIWLPCKLLDFLFFPFCMVSFLLMNLLLLKLIFPVLDDFSSYHTVSRMYIYKSHSNSCTF